MPGQDRGDARAGELRRPETIRALVDAGADVFRLNFSHGSHAEHRARYDLIRRIEAEVGRPIGVLADLQGPKLRIGRLVEAADAWRRATVCASISTTTPGTPERVPLPHPEVLAALAPGVQLLLDDGKLRLEVEDAVPARRPSPGSWSAAACPSARE